MADVSRRGDCCLFLKRMKTLIISAKFKYVSKEKKRGGNIQYVEWLSFWWDYLT